MRAALATNRSLEEPMLVALKKGNAADAVACGLFAAAALDPSVLLGFAPILVGGTGAGLRAIDGRARQPGAGIKRPRGFRPGDPIPEAARVAVPGLPPAALLLHGSRGSAPMSALVAIVRALVRGPRRDVLERVMGGGSAALAKEPELLAAAGPLAGGLLSADDLETVHELDVACSGRAPREWGKGNDEGSDVAKEIAATGDAVEVLVAADARGLLVAACYGSFERGLEIPSLDLVAPLLAVPVMRGVPRTPPGTPLPVLAPLAILGKHAIAAKTEDALLAALEGIRGGPGAGWTQQIGAGTGALLASAP